jgi:hypothetical protein
MVGPRIFILPEELQKWLEKAGAKFESGALTIPDLPAPYKMEAALHFSKLVAGNEDPGTLVGKIKTILSIQQAGLERFQNSVIAGDNAYEVEEGFLVSWDEELAARPAQGAPEKPAAEKKPGEPPAAPAPPTAPEPAAAPRKKSKKTAQAKDDPEDMLARLLLEKLK